MKYFANMFQAVSMDFVADELADKVLPTLVETAYGQSPAGEKGASPSLSLGSRGMDRSSKLRTLESLLCQVQQSVPHFHMVAGRGGAQLLGQAFKKRPHSLFQQESLHTNNILLLNLRARIELFGLT